jgi:hypothetical protein
LIRACGGALEYPGGAVADVPTRAAGRLIEVNVTKVFSLLQFIAELPAIERDVHASGPKIVEQACKIIQRKAKAAIGKEHEMWAPLAPSTIADKAHHGYPTPKPLLRSGELRDSIQYQVHGLEGAVGSDLDRALWLEMGTSRIPPRSFLVSSAISSEDKIHRMAAAVTIAAFSGLGGHAREVREMLHLFRHLGHELRGLAEDLLDHDDDEKDGK